MYSIQIKSTYLKYHYKYSTLNVGIQKKYSILQKVFDYVNLNRYFTTFNSILLPTGQLNMSIARLTDIFRQITYLYNRWLR